MHPENKNLSLACIGLALYFVTALWGFWDMGTYALGSNGSLCTFALISICLFLIQATRSLQKSDLLWFLPICLIAISYSLYENPFLKAINFLVLPLVLCFGLAFNSPQDSCLHSLKLRNILTLISCCFLKPIAFLSRASSLHSHTISSLIKLKKQNVKEKTTTKRVLKGLLLSLLLLCFVVLPILSSADAQFAASIEWLRIHFLVPLWNIIFDESIVWRTVIGTLFSICALAAFIAWSDKKSDGKINIENKDDAHTLLDPIVSGIVLCSVLAAYILFLILQVKQLWVAVLPVDFKTTEALVKQGFWQLLFLTSLNIGFCIFINNRSNKFVQHTLQIFTVASLLLLISAAYRLGLYVTYYGFSYEKFFASYTVVYCFIMYGALLFLVSVASSKSLGKYSFNVVRFSLFLFVWMYGVVSILPVERGIISANIALSSIEGSRLNLSEMKMLSIDVLPIIMERGVDLRETDDSKTSHKKQIVLCDTQNRGGSYWKWWLSRTTQQHLNRKSWYEHTVSSLLALRYKEKVDEIINASDCL